METVNGNRNSYDIILLINKVINKENQRFLLIGMLSSSTSAFHNNVIKQT